MLKKNFKNQAFFPIGLGAMPLSLVNRPSESTSIKIIEAFLNHGGNFIDTADVYGLDENDSGHNEKLIHKALKQLGMNERVIVATKGGATRPNGGWGLRGGHPQKLRQACEESLKNLNITTHELYYLHGPDPEVPLEDSLGELIQLKEEGKIKNLGIANVTLSELKQAVSLTTIVAVQNRCNPFCKEDFKNGIISFCKEMNIIYVPYCPLGGFADHGKLAKSEKYDYLTAKYSVSSYAISLAWLRLKDNHIVPIPGMDQINHVIENFGSRALQLEQQDMNLIDQFPDYYQSKHWETK